jgi:type I restriction enzyme S subunit
MRAKHAVNQASINQQDVSGFRVSHPPIELQREFARRVTAVEKLKAAHRALLAELDALFAALQHRAFRGEL